MEVNILLVDNQNVAGIVLDLRPQVGRTQIVADRPSLARYPLSVDITAGVLSEGVPGLYASHLHVHMQDTVDNNSRPDSRVRRKIGKLSEAEVA